MTHASLFSGIGGAELAAAWMGWRNLFHCEINPFGRQVLEYWFPDSKSYEDITTTDFTPWRGKVSVLTGGFPCQPFSLAGRRKGAADDRYLWPQMLRAIREIEPTWVVGENVAGLATMVQPGETVDMGRTDSLFEEDHLYRTTQRFTLDDITASLEDSGYAVQSFLIPACAVGAPHRRDRLWIVAHRTDTGAENQSARAEQPDSAGLAADTIDAGVRAPRHGRERKGTAQSSEGQDRPLGRACRPRDKRTSADTKCDRGLHVQQTVRPDDTTWVKPNGTGCERAAADTVGVGRKHACANDDGKLEEPSQEERRAVEPRRTDCPQDWWGGWPSVSPVCRGNDGLSFDISRLTISEPKWRAEAIKAMGNAWVPQVAYEIFRAIGRIENS